jgi:hypothetical protein
MSNNEERSDEKVDEELQRAQRQRREAELLTAIGDASGAIVDETPTEPGADET